MVIRVAPVERSAKQAPESVKSVPQPGVVTIVVHESKAEFVVARQDNIYEKPLTEWPVRCYAAAEV